MAVMQLKDKNNKPIKTKDGRSWYFKVYYNDLSGNRKQYKSKKYVSKKDAQDSERLFLISLTDKVDNNNLTIHELLLLYMDFQKDRVKITTYQNYNKYKEKIELIGKIKIIDYNLTIFNNWKNEINKRDYSTRYKNNIYKVLRELLNHAIKYYNYNCLIPIINKMTGFNNPNELKKEMNFYTYEEFIKFIDQEEELKYKTYFEMLYYCGLRRSEANALTWEDINFRDKTININKNISTKIKGQQYVIIPPKTKSSYRTLPMPNILYNDMKELYKYYSKYSNFTKTWFVFGGSLPLADSTITKHKDNCCKKSNLKNIRIHDLRHSCASLLISNGASISLVAKYLGHSNLSTTLNVYTHLFKNEFNDIMEVINKL